MAENLADQKQRVQLVQDYQADVNKVKKVRDLKQVIDIKMSMTVLFQLCC